MYVFLRLLLSSFMILGLAACQTESDSVGGKGPSRAVIKNMPEFRLRVFYESGGAPYVGSIVPNGMKTWSIIEYTLADTLPPAVRTLTIPYAVDEMTQISIGKNRCQKRRLRGRTNPCPYTEERLRRIAQDQKFAQLGENINTLSVIYINGVYVGPRARRSRKDNANTVGLHFPNTPTVFIFKPAIKAMGGTTSQQKIAEQAVVAHEIGHALGLVNSTLLPMDARNPHEDHSSPTHCSNKNCVMYKHTNAPKTALRFADQIRKTGRYSLFGKECLHDLKMQYPQ